VDALTRALADGDPVVPPNAAWALGKLGKAAEPAVGGLLRALERRDEGLRTNALDSLVQIGVNVDRSLPRFQKAMGLLRQMLKDPDPQVREKTAALLVNLGEIASPCLPELVAALRDQEAPVRKAAALALSKMIHKCEAEEAARAVPALLRALEQDPEQEVRLRIAWVFLDIPADLRRTPEALDVMVRVSRQDRVPIVRYETARGAARHFGAEARAVVPTLIQHLKSPTTHIVSNSVAKVNSAGAEGGGQATLEDEAGKDGRVLPAAALGLLGDAAGPEARKALEEAANDPSPELRIAAKQALRNFRK
jgi:HEAT repeat protein